MDKISIALKYSKFSDSIEGISNGLGLEPTNSNVKGERYSLQSHDGRIEKQYQYNYWEYRFVIETDEWIQTVANSFIDEVVEPRKEQLKRIASKGQLEFFIGAELYGMANPGFHFEKETIALVAYIGAEIDIDLYNFTAKE